GGDLEPIAWAADGVIEAVINKRSDQFVMGVQWHPEVAWQNDRLSQAIFSHFISVARERRESLRLVSAPAKAREPATPRSRMTKKDKVTLAGLCAGHFVNDGYSSIIFPILPLLKDALHLTTAQVFWLAPLYAISSSLMQPVYGFISDRYARRFFTVFGPAIT